MAEHDPIETLIAWARDENIAWVQASSVFPVPLPRDQVIKTLTEHWQCRPITTELDEEQAQFVFRRCQERYLARFVVSCGAGAFVCDCRQVGQLEAHPCAPEMFQGGAQIRFRAGALLLELHGGPVVKIVRAERVSTVSPEAPEAAPPLTREEAVAKIIADGKVPATVGYPDKDFVADVKGGCSAAENAKGFHRRTLRRIYDRLKNAQMPN